MNAQQWHLKKYDDGSVFGPVDVATLHDWASKGEISPYDMLSRDGVKWMAAPELTELDMNWIVEFPDGEMYGPTCIEAIRAFLNDGQLMADNSIRNATTGDKCFISEHPEFQDLVSPTTESEAAPAETEEPNDATATEEEDVGFLRQRVAELEEINAKMQAAHEAARDQLNQELMTARTQHQFLRSELDLLKQTSPGEPETKETAGETVAELDQLREQFDILFELNKQLTQNYEVSVGQLNRKIQDTLATIEQNAEREAELNQHVAEAAQREAKYREQLVAMEKELMKGQEAHADLLSKYSQLNERLMKFLDKES
jgi:hypothetical protein